MAKVTITVNQQLDECGDEFLGERDFEIEFDFDEDPKYVICVIDGKPNCYIKASDLLVVLAVVTANHTRKWQP